MTDVKRARKALVQRLVEGEGDASREQRRAAFDGGTQSEPLAILLEKVRRSSHAVTDEDVARVRESGFTEDQIFELVVCAAVGEANRKHDAALAALDAMGE